MQAGKHKNRHGDRMFVRQRSRRKRWSKKKKTADFDLFADFGTVNEGNIIAGAVMQAVEETQNRESGKKSAEHEKICTRLIATWLGAQ